MAETLRTYLPWTSSPLIVNAPMGGFAGGSLAASVSSTGGLGMIGAIQAADLEKELAIASEALQQTHSAPKQEDNILPIGVGLLTFVATLDSILPVLQKHNPAVVWLFAAKSLDDYTTWATSIRQACPKTKIWIQTGTVSNALTIAQSAKPDALVMQGSDAGGHGLERGASIIALLPEAIDTLSAYGQSHIPILASGGIADARGAAAAFALGANGVVIGTRFFAAKETVVPEGYRQLVLSTKDGSTNTVRSKLFDNVKGPNIWPAEYDGRSLVTESYNDHVGGVEIERIREIHNDAVGREDEGFGETNRANVWAGASVGLVNQVEDARNIVLEVREGIEKVLKGVVARL